MKYTMKEIGDKVGCSPSYVHKVVTAFLKEVNSQSVNETSQMVIQMQLDLEDIIKVHWNSRGIPENAKIIMKAMDQLARLRGLNEETTQVNVALPVQINYNVAE